MFDDEIVKTKNRPVKGYNFLFYTVFMFVLLSILVASDVKPERF